MSGGGGGSQDRRQVWARRVGAHHIPGNREAKWHRGRVCVCGKAGAWAEEGVAGARGHGGHRPK